MCNNKESMSAKLKVRKRQKENVDITFIDYV